MSNINSSASIIGTAGDPSNFPIRITARDGSLLSWVDENGFLGGNFKIGAGGGVPAGSSGDFQFNNNGIFGNANDLTPGMVATTQNGGMAFVAAQSGGGFGFGAGPTTNNIIAVNPTVIGIIAGESGTNLELSADQNINITSTGGGQITFNGTIQMGGPVIFTVPLSVFANNAAAIAGGLAVGSLYRTGANPDVVCVVH